MKTICVSLRTILLLSMMSGWVISCLYAQFAGGSGTEADPYQMATTEHLNNVRDYLTSYFIQTADIDLGVAPWNVGEGWVPIGSYIDLNNPANVPFQGKYD